MNIYADHAATTAMSEAAIDAMAHCMREQYGNPSSLYTVGQRAKERLEEARKEGRNGLTSRKTRIQSRTSTKRRQALRGRNLPRNSRRLDRAEAWAAVFGPPRLHLVRRRSPGFARARPMPQKIQGVWGQSPQSKAPFSECRTTEKQKSICKVLE